MLCQTEKQLGFLYITLLCAAAAAAAVAAAAVCADDVYKYTKSEYKLSRACIQLRRARARAIAVWRESERAPRVLLIASRSFKSPGHHI